MRLAILDALAQGAWSAGDKPAERDIASEVGLSLGTVQKTLSALAVDGVLSGVMVTAHSLRVT